MRKNFLNSFSKIFVAGILAVGAVSCGEKSEEKMEIGKNVLHVYSWAEYIPSEVFEGFEKETGIKIMEDIYSTNEEMFTKLKAGATGYDLVLPSPDYVEIMMKENMLDKIDKSKISTFENLDKNILKRLSEFDPNNEYTIPYAVSATLIVVNTKYVKDYPRDYSIYERSDLKGRMTLLDDMREVLGSGLLMSGYPQTVGDEKAFKEAEEKIKGWKKNIAKFDSESFGKNFASEDFLVVQGYGENIYMELTEEQKKHTDFIVPEKGGLFSLDSFVILKTAPNKEAAHKFIEYVHRPEVYALVADYLVLPSINVPAREFTEEKPLFKIEDLEKCELLRDTTSTLSIQNKYWEKIKGGF
ncbi:extracellular solute-binding protein [Fusobacterium sp.]|uniref:extracellular solute-binding protein n=1 Tax=Fusobacterium sp. TaxID=68766 RepID=UPI00262BE40D|nr:extracellular solute-binding protein [Fusobacterium sp.]